MNLEAVRDVGSGESYPRHLLDRCTNALVLFAAGFHGRQDAFWVAEAGVTATCVDLDARRVKEMSRMYPANWEFIVAEVFEYAATCDQEFDLVSIDCPTGAFVRCADLVETWCDLARVAVVLGTGKDVQVTPPTGWKLTERRHRSNFKGGVEWAVLESV